MDALKKSKFTVIAVILVWFAAQETRGSNAYLRQTGPTPLRFSIAMAVPASFALPQCLTEHRAPTNHIETTFPTTTSIDTNALATHPSPVSDPITPAVPSATESPSIPPPKTAASDLLVVSPQMLTEFFKPEAEGTNSVTPGVLPAPVGFTPPSAPPSSRATYNRP